MSKLRTETVTYGTDDLTGVDSRDAQEIKISVNGKNATLVMLPATLAALTALVTAESPADRTRALRAVLGTGPAGSAARKRSGSRSGSAAGSGSASTRTAEREWLAANGYPQYGPGARGKINADAHAAYLAANVSASEPASTPASEPASK